MKTTKKEKRLRIFILLLLSITLGYALLSQTLNINGTSKIKKTTWKVIWDNVVINENSVSGDAVTQAAEITNNEKTLVEYSITLSKPGDFYEFTVDAKNEGSIDAMVNIVSNKVYESNGTTEKELPEYLTYSVTYLDGQNIKPKHLLSTGATETYNVRVEFIEVSADKLPAQEETLKFKFSVDYVQANKDAISRPTPGILPDYDETNGCADITTDSSGGGGNATMSGLTLMMKNATQGEDDPSWFTDTAANQSQTGVYTRKGTSNDEYPIYYYRGAYGSVNNNLIFNNYCWKIVRTTATGGIRIIYNGPASNGQCTTQTGSTTYIQRASFNTSYDDSKYVKYIYDNNGTPTDSNLKTVLEAWYNTNMSSVDNKIEKSIYCNDTSEMTPKEMRALNLYIYNPYNWYCPYKRARKGTPTTLCSKKSDAYKLKVGFLTVDEEVLAGRSWNNGMEDYLYNNYNYWLGSPNYIYSSGAPVFFVSYADCPSSYNVDNAFGVRPVVSLSANTNYTGTGTTTNPFVVE